MIVRGRDPRARPARAPAGRRPGQRARWGYGPGIMKIGELAKVAGVNPRTLRYYERIGLLTPARRSDAGYRLYTARDAERLAFIRHAQRLGLSLRAIAEILAVRDAGT